MPLRSVAGLGGIVPDVSCVNDAKDAGGTCRRSWDSSRHDMFHIAQNYFPIWGHLWFLITDPLKKISVFFAEL